MLDVTKLSQNQLDALKEMMNFDCMGISCDDCPLNLENDCGSLLAQGYVNMVMKERV